MYKDLKIGKDLRIGKEFNSYLKKLVGDSKVLKVEAEYFYGGIDIESIKGYYENNIRVEIEFEEDAARSIAIYSNDIIIKAFEYYLNYNDLNLMETISFDKYGNMISIEFESGKLICANGTMIKFERVNGESVTINGKNRNEVQQWQLDLGMYSDSWLNSFE